jgi:hypothetical protein
MSTLSDVQSRVVANLLAQIDCLKAENAKKRKQGEAPWSLAASSNPAAEFVALWQSGACDKVAHARLAALLARCKLSGRMIHGYEGEQGFGRLLSSDEWKRLSWVFGPEALTGFLGKSAREICLQLGFGQQWLEAKLKDGKLFKLAIFPSESADSKPATWSGVECLLETNYPEVWPKIAAHLPKIRSLSFAAVEAEAGYSMLDVNLVGRNHANGESKDDRYISLQRLGTWAQAILLWCMCKIC